MWAWFTQKNQKDIQLECLNQARFHEEWEAAAFALDELHGNDLWRQSAPSKHYDYRLIYSRLQYIIEARDDDDILALVNLLRSGLVRNLGSITTPRLFNRAYAGTKLLIEDYITQVALAIEHVAAYPTSLGYDEGGLTSQAKLDLLHDTRQAFGRSVLVLQGGSIFGLCHIGVVKALHLRGLLPRIISGSATGALVAALVGIHREEELLPFLSGDGLDLRAFTASSERAAIANPKKRGWWPTLLRRARRFVTEGYVLDAVVLEQCVRANVGDLTFMEAYQRTKRVLNITIASPGGRLPTLLNYLTAPNVVSMERLTAKKGLPADMSQLIWTAALASNTSIVDPVFLQCKDGLGNITPWTSISDATLRPSIRAQHVSERDSPLHRIAELFNVNHFVVSQARPYIAPFLQSDMHSPKPRYAGRSSMTMTTLKVMVMEIQHRLNQLDFLGFLSPSIRRFLLDENIPGPSLTLVPDVTLADFTKMLENPTKKSVEYWILKGERSVWPAIGALKIRCAVEVELDRAYQMVRRRKPFDASPTATVDNLAAPDRTMARKRIRAASTGAGAGTKA